MSDTDTAPHVPVLLDAVMAGLNIRRDGTYVDGTFGRGGHSREILRRLGANGRLLAIDRDPAAVTVASDTLGHEPRFDIVRGEIASLEKIAAERELLGKVDGLLLDLGVSSPQLDEAGRGFSFRHDGPLDMRMDPDAGPGAAEWLASVDEKTLKQVLFQYGEERQAVRIARAIVRQRDIAAITRTRELADLVEACAPARGQRIHAATRTFQAIRIAVNDELGQLERGLAAVPALLRRGGRLCAISFHSLEDRRVKRFMRSQSQVPEPYRGLPTVPAEYQPPLRIVSRVIKGSAAEISANARARSARLRIAEKL